jgi:Na+/melibiose symporter-like transporter
MRALLLDMGVTMKNRTKKILLICMEILILLVMLWATLVQYFVFAVVRESDLLLDLSALARIMALLGAVFGILWDIVSRIRKRLSKYPLFVWIFSTIVLIISTLIETLHLMNIEGAASSQHYMFLIFFIIVLGLLIRRHNQQKGLIC